MCRIVTLGTIPRAYRQPRIISRVALADYRFHTGFTPDIYFGHPRVKLLPAIALLGLPAIGFSQWVHYPTAGVPRKADGTPNLAAPAPRLADGKLDFSVSGTPHDSYRATPS
jgi:hypothetical protein